MAQEWGKPRPLFELTVEVFGFGVQGVPVFRGQGGVSAVEGLAAGLDRAGGAAQVGLSRTRRAGAASRTYG